MRKIDEMYFLLSLLWLVAGMVFGIWLGATHQLNFGESHAHMALVGFVVSAIFGIMYRFYPAMSGSRVSSYQFWIYQLGAVVLVAGKIRVDAGGDETLVKIGSIVILLGTVLMLYVFATKRQGAVAQTQAAVG